MVQLASGTPVASQGYSHQVQATRAQAIALSATLCLTFLLAGLAMIAQFYLSTIEVDEQGLRFRNLFGQLSFNAPWSEIERVSVRRRKRCLFYSIHHKYLDATFDNT